MKLYSFLLPALAILVMGSLRAAADTVPNYDFSSPDVTSDDPYGPSNGYGYNQTVTFGDSTTITDWTTGGNGDENQSWGIINNTVNPQYASLPAGNDQFAYENVLDSNYGQTGDTGATDTLTSNISLNFVVGDSYDVSVGVGASAYNGHDGTYFIDLTDNGMVVASGTLDGDSIASGTFATLSLTTPYTATDTGALGIVIGFTNTQSQFQQANFNDVTLTSSSPSVPEPSSYALLGLGLAMFVFLLRLKKRQS